MRVIAVIDLMAGQVVRAARGDRAAYRPLVSPLVADSSPGRVARALADEFGLSDVYVADLDAIAGAEPDCDSLRQIAAAGMRLWVDAGVSCPERAGRLRDFFQQAGMAGRGIVGLESVAGPEMLGELCEAAGGERAVFSLDLKAGVPLAGPGWSRIITSAAVPASDAAAPTASTGSTTSIAPRGAALAIASAAVAAGFRTLIVLDLAQVGTSSGPSIGELCRAVRRNHIGVEIVGGGGVRDARDLNLLAGCGCDAALVATALHEGALTRVDVTAAGEF